MDRFSETFIWEEEIARLMELRSDLYTDHSINEVFGEKSEGSTKNKKYLESIGIKISLDK